jgi:Na+/proline symporter
MQWRSIYYEGNGFMDLTVSNDITAIVILLFLLFTLLLGMWHGFNIKTIREYAIGDKTFPTIVIISTIVGTWIDGGSTFAPASNSYDHGILALLPQLGLVVYLYIISKFIAPLMKPFLNMISIGEIIGSMYGQGARFITGIFSVIRSCGAISIQIFVLSGIFDYLSPGNRYEYMVMSTLILFTYTAFGGIKSVAYTDCFQSFIIIITLLTIIYFSLKEIGGIYKFASNIPTSHISIKQHKIQLISHIILFIFFCIPSFIPTVIQQMLIAKEIDKIKCSFKVASLILFLYFILVLITGIAAYEINPNANPKYAIMCLVDITVPPAFKGFIICGLISIMMSTVDGHLNTASVCLTNDVVKLIWPSLKEYYLILILRSSTFILGIVTFFIASRFENIIDLLLFIDGLWRPIITFPFMLGLLGFRSTSKVFMASITIGFLVYSLLVNYPLFPYMNNLLAIIIGFLANGATLLIIKYFPAFTRRYKPYIN